MSENVNLEFTESEPNPDMRTEFNVGSNRHRIKFDREASTLRSPVTITKSLILHPVQLCTEVLDSQESVTGVRDGMFLLWNKKGKRGWSFVDGGIVTINELRFDVGEIYPLDSMATPRLAQRWRDGETVDMMIEYEKNLDQICQRVEFPTEASSHIATLYRIGTHFHPAFNAFPFLDFVGPPASGKTKANYTIAAATLHPLLTPNLSNASFYYWRQATGCTLVIDEKNLSSRYDDAIADLVNSAYKRGGKVSRVMKDSSGQFKPKIFSVYGPIQYSGARILPQMMSTRTLTIPMKRTLKSAYSSFDDLLPDSPEAVELRESLYLARLCHGFEAYDIYESIKPTDFGLRNHKWELAHPLLTVAMLIDKELIKFVLDFFKQSKEETSGYQ